MSQHPATNSARQVRSAAALRDWRDPVYRWRDRLLGSPRFQRWALALPIARGVAQRSERELFDLCAGFVYSQVLLACVRLGVLGALAEQPLTAACLARRIGLPPPATERLLDAAAGLRLVARRSGGRYGLGLLGAAVTGNAGVAAMIAHHAMLYDDLADITGLLRGGGPPDTRLATYWAYAGAAQPAGLTSEAVQDYTALMSASQPLVAGDVLDAYPIARHRKLLDVGGGAGGFLVAAAQRSAELEVILFDLPAVAASAADTFAAAGLSARARAVGGDFLADPLPRGADAISLVRVLLDHDDAAAARILGACRAALPQGGVLLLAEPMVGQAGTVGDVYFNLYLLAMGRGRPRSIAALRTLLGAAGFARVRHVKTRRPLMTSLLIAHA